MTDAEAAELEKEERSRTTLVGGLDMDQPLDEETVKSALRKLALQEAAIRVQKANIEKAAAEDKAKIEKAAAEDKASSEARKARFEEEKAKSEARMAKIKEEAAADMAKIEKAAAEDKANIEKAAAEDKAKIEKAAAEDKAKSDARRAKLEEEAIRTDLGQKDQDQLGPKVMAAMLVKATERVNSAQQHWADIKQKTS
ncbi:hypothetical protein CHLRE_13g565400v5 [Chlamydomonas reinhardtii]|uniref:Uncharacterized protein n=1 Tax=Chlamydomonas reinhardtii TaxID=3055 RepID=A0A2K3CZ87_CHLRE|nr:uncharacterized protein CHLRE_13g565400v5 [Chlamydomonas reinhardtii]PNW73603.1 hypothetical protein CHLRE_13g565400v5 [Chlamydomonas reinhardtii]